MEFTPDPARGREVYDLDRAHVFHSWSAQGVITPFDDRVELRAAMEAAR